MKQKGFTLIELLAVIVILAIIALMVTPLIMNVINAARENGAKASAQNYAHAVEVGAFNLQIDNEIDISNGKYKTSFLDKYVSYNGPKVRGSVTLNDGVVIGYDLYVNDYHVIKDGTTISTELSDGEVHNEENDVDITRGTDVIHISDSSNLQTGDVYVNGQYEYHYNVYYTGSAWSNNTSLNGWSMIINDEAKDDEAINTEMITKILGKNVVSMRYLFSGSSAKNIDLSSFNTSNVISMNHMFSGCGSLEVADVSNFNTANVTDMSFMFSDCTSLSEIDVSGFNTDKVSAMLYMFNNCNSVKTLDVSSFNTSKVTSMERMFRRCWTLKTLDVSNFDTSNVTDMTHMFCNSNKLESIVGLTNFNTEKVVKMEWTFAYLGKITELDLSSFDTSNVTNMNGVFLRDGKLVTIYVSDKWNTSSVTKSTDMFLNCTSIKGGQNTVFDSSNITVTYAHVDGGTTNPGYLTFKNS